MLRSRSFLFGLSLVLIASPSFAADTVFLSGIPTDNILKGSVRIEARPSFFADKVLFSLSGAKSYSHTENGLPFTLAPSSENELFDTKAYPDGTYTLSVKAYKGSTVVQASRTVEIDNLPDTSSLKLTGVSEGAILKGTADIRALPEGMVDYVLFTLRGPKDYEKRENGAPYTLFGGTGANVRIWDTRTFPDGPYTLKVDAVKGTSTQTTTIRFTVANKSTSPSPQPDDPHASPSIGGKLRWKPPALSNPTTIHLKDGFTKVRLDAGKDYTLKMPSYPKKGGTHISGGRNVVIIGGHVQIPSIIRADDGKMISCDHQKNCNNPGDCNKNAHPPTSWDYHQYCRAFFIYRNSGTVHIEGVLIDGTKTKQDAFATKSPGSKLQIQNVRIEGLYGDEPTWHADVIEPWGGIGELRMDYVTAYTKHQGLQIAPDSKNGAIPEVGKVIVSNMNIEGEGQYKIMPAYSGCRFPDYMEFSNLYMTPIKGKTLGYTVNPSIGSRVSCKAKGYGTGSAMEVDWPSANMQGRIKSGPPPKGDFVPKGVAGTNYHSPGYQ